jgi:hypothetical protein
LPAAKAARKVSRLMYGEMKEYVAACAAGASARRLPAVLDRVVAAPALHARFVNTLSRLEYVGVRKMLKSRRAEALDLDGLQHALDETVHALRLKKIAVSLGAAAARDVATYADDHTLAGDEGEGYIQALDRAAAGALIEMPERARPEASYRLTSAAIEVRAQVFYPAYEACLRARGAAFSVAAIMRDEDRHLEEMAAGLAATIGEGSWRRRLEAVLAVEESLFARFLDAVERAAPAA